MSLIRAYDFADLSLVQGLVTKDQNVAGASYPAGIPGVTAQGGMLVTAMEANDASIDSGHRSEIYLTPDTVVENWYYWEFMLPAVYWNEKLPSGITMGQMHDSPAVGVPTRQPNFMLQFMNGSIYTVWPRAALPTESTTFTRFPAANYALDQWHSVCIRFNWQVDSTGFREVYIDRIPVYREWNVATGYNDATLPYFRLGIYNTTGGAVADKVAYFRNLRRYSGNDGYQTVMGGVPKILTNLSINT